MKNSSFRVFFEPKFKKMYREKNFSSYKPCSRYFFLLKKLELTVFNRNIIKMQYGLKIYNS